MAEDTKVPNRPWWKKLTSIGVVIYFTGRAVALYPDPTVQTVGNLIADAGLALGGMGWGRRQGYNNSLVPSLGGAMKKTSFLWWVFLLIFLVPGIASAGVMEGLKGMVSMKVLAYVLTFLAGLGIISIYFDWFMLQLVNFGTLLISIGMSWLNDKKFTVEEFNDIKIKFKAFKDAVKLPNK